MTERRLIGSVAAVLAAAALAMPSGAAAQVGEDPYCDQPHSLNPPEFHCGPETVLNPFLKVLHPIWPLGQS